MGFCKFFEFSSFDLYLFGLNQLRSETVIHVRNWESKNAVRNWVKILVLCMGVVSVEIFFQTVSPKLLELLHI